MPFAYDTWSGSWGSSWGDSWGQQSLVVADPFGGILTIEAKLRTMSASTDLLTVESCTGILSTAAQPAPLTIAASGLRSIEA